MKHYLVSTSSLHGSISIPPSKSHTMRAILFAALAKGKSIIRNYLASPDTNYMIQACKMLGSSITIKQDQLLIEGIDGSIPQIEDVIIAGNSGLILRFLTAITALSPSYSIITGDHSIRHQRPMKTLLDALTQLGVFAVSARGDGYAPLIIKGPLMGGKAEVNGEDSQPVSSLLMAGALAQGPTELIVKNPGEKPWVDLTLSWLDRLGIKYTNENYERFIIPGKGHFEGFEYTVPGDWSSAAFPIAAALITQSEIIIENVDMSDPQGDKEIVFAFKQMGANIELDDVKKRLIVRSGSKLRGTTIDINQFIDSITVLAAVSCYAEGETRLINAAIARHKECDRIHSITVELQKMGATISELDDGLIIRGEGLNGAEVVSYNDHRMVMSLAVAALGAKGDSKVDNVECVSKTFPNFVESFQHLGAKIREQNL